MHLLSHPFWIESEIYMDLNFGLVDFNTTHIQLKILNREAEVLIAKNLAFADLIYNEQAIKRHAKMCEATHRDHKLMLHLCNYLE
jgi:hypothetical protein